ncbi:mobile element protein [Liquorilactobacillus sucicola DSM 21376 = JCM 15457]|uniref:Transposase IS204/IS1001/IS1096/IS1165 DDE domain-containing protein n=1 Tax=Liquorilactobacillus sucicola DSM 21376 = JCM 15457 TaxID=1423806 RepID=A0A023CYJ4_9LACO|nr:hypothetical protein FD15_GL000775 [Liquorilactobacillus sucicola DSM 21376 = JCM 15457]GAJ26879.1 mobile element protein [Liquorilactobacillus sucicola DSM 21376 = JCM 15457]
MSFIAIDVDTNRLVSTLPDRLNRNIKKHFQSNYSLAERRKNKQIKRTAYGYKNCSHFYTQIRIEFTIQIKKENQFENELIFP